MSKLDTFRYLWKNNKRGIAVALFDKLVHTGVLNLLSDKRFVSLMYRVHTGKKINLKYPTGFNEKLQWLKLHDRNNNYIDLVDKARVKEIVGETIGTEYTVPTLGIWDKVEEIDISNLPERFVLKCTHDSGSVCICRNIRAFDLKLAQKRLSKALRNNLYYWGREWPYKDVKPRILAEEYLADDDNNDLIDYKFMCFNGEVKCVFTVTNRFSHSEMHVTFYDLDWNILPFTRHYKADNTPIKKPKSFDLMLNYSKILSKDIPFARIDWYEVNAHPYFGEITLYPGNGVEEFSPDEWDYIMGSWLDLPRKMVNK